MDGSGRNLFVGYPPSVALRPDVQVFAAEPLQRV